MKFEKFVKSLASSGVIHERSGDDRWLSSASVFMRIPLGTRSVTGVGVQPMPQAIDRMIDQIGHIEPAHLTEAVMPYPDGKIKDCVRVYRTQDKAVSIPISNDDWSLIEKANLCEILYAYDLDTDTYEAKALLVKSYPLMPDEEVELVGIILPVITTD